MQGAGQCRIRDEDGAELNAICSEERCHGARGLTGKEKKKKALPSADGLATSLCHFHVLVMQF